eukprot:m.203945 g.203945  ORF g.203945 m.203945 type:complete len:900 (+) comp39634_c1_seq13:32-2731(+)
MAQTLPARSLSASSVSSRGLFYELQRVPLPGLHLFAGGHSQAASQSEWLRGLLKELKYDPCLTNKAEGGKTALHAFFDYLREHHFDRNYDMDEQDCKLIQKGILNLMSGCTSEFVTVTDDEQRTIFHYIAWANVHSELLQAIFDEVRQIFMMEGREEEALFDIIRKTDKQNKSALEYALEAKEKVKPENIILLLQYGARFDDEKLLAIEKVDQLEELLIHVTQTLAYREKPEDLCIKLVARLREQADRHKYDGTKDRFLKVSEELEDLTVAMLGDASYDSKIFHLINPEHFELAKKRGLKKYLASGGAQQFVNRKWYGLDVTSKASQNDANLFCQDLFLGSKGGKFLQERLGRAVITGLHWYHYFWLILLFLVENVLYIFSGSLLANRLRVLYIPAIAYGAQSIMFFVFVALLMARVEENSSPVTAHIIHSNIRLEAFVMLFCLGFILDKLVDLFLWLKKQRNIERKLGERKTSAALKWEYIPFVVGSIINVLLIINLTAFIVAESIFLAKSHGTFFNCSSNLANSNGTFLAKINDTFFNCFSAAKMSSDSESICLFFKLSQYFLGFGAAFASLNLLIIFRLHSTLGPLQLAFWSLGPDVFYFLVMLSTFGLAFAAVMTSTYQTAHNRVNASPLQSLFSSLLSLFWTLFGLKDLDSFTSNKSEESVLLQVFIGLWLLLASVILLNMLIGLVTLVFQNIYENAEHEWKYTRAIVIMDLEPGMIFPLPLGWLSILLGAIFQKCHRKIPQNEEQKIELENQTEENQGAVSQMQHLRVKERIREARGSSKSTRSDIDELIDKMDNLESRLQSEMRDMLDAIMKKLNPLKEGTASGETDLSETPPQQRWRAAKKSFIYKKQEDAASLVKRFVPSLSLSKLQKQISIKAVSKERERKLLKGGTFG